MNAQLLAHYAGVVQIDGPDVKGRILTPGTFTPVVDGQPAEVEFTREVILAAYDRLKEKVDAGHIEMRLSHPNVGDMPIRWGKATEVRVDRGAGDVWLSASQPFPEMERLLTDEARDRLKGMGLSVNSAMRLRAKTDAKGNPIKGKYTCTWLEIDAIDIVDAGAFAGSDITQEIPAGLAAKSQSNAKPGGSGPALDKESETTMPKINDINEIPADVREQLGDDKTMQAYMEAYNAAIEAGKDPVEASEAALRAATKQTAAKDPDTGPEDMKKGKAKDATAQLRARLAAKEQEAADIRTQLATEAEKTVSLSARLASLEGNVKTLQAKNAELEQAKLDAEAEKDVEWAIVSARRALPAERPSLLKIRKALGHAEFEASIKARAQVIPIGEKGREKPAGDEAMEAESKAQELLAKFGVEGVFQAGLHQGNRAPGIVQVMAKQYPDHPLVRREVQRLKATTATGGA